MSRKSNIQPRRRLLNLAVLAALGGGALAPASTSAATLYWVCGSNAWDATCWSNAPGGAPALGQPQNGDTVNLTQSDATNRTVDYSNTAYPSAALDILTVDANGTGSMTLSQTKDSLAASQEYIGVNGTVAFNHSGGTNTASNGLYVGSNDPYGNFSSSSYNLSGTGSLSASSELIGGGGGTFNQSGGTNAVGSLDIGVVSFGAYNLSAGSLTAGGITIGSSSLWGGGMASAGTFTQSGGVATVGNIAIRTGQYSMSAGNLLSAGNMSIFIESGSFGQSGGTHSVSGDLNISYHPYGSGYILGGTGILSAANERITSYFTPSDSFAAFNQNGGNHTVSGNLTIEGGYNLSAGSLSAANEIIGEYGAGTFNQTGGTNTATNSLTLGLYAGSSGSYILSGGTHTVGTLILGYQGGGSYSLSAGSLSAGSETIGSSGTGVFNQSGGTHTVANNLTLGQSAGSSGTYNQSCGTLNVGGNIVGGAGSSTFNLNGGTLNFSGSSIALDSFNIGNDWGSTGSFTLGGGQSLAANAEIIGYKNLTATFIQNGGTNTTVGLAIGAGIVYEGNPYYQLQNPPSSVGTYSLNAGSLSVNREFIGVHGYGTFSQDGGTHTVGDLNIGVRGGGTYNMSAGSLSASFEIIGTSGGDGIFNQAGGIHTVGDLLLGSSSSIISNGSFDGFGSGSYNLSAGSLSANFEGIGNGFYGSGTFTQSGGVHTVGNLAIGSGGIGSYTLTAGSLSVGSEAITGNYVDGFGHSSSFTQSGGTHTVNGDLTLDGYYHYIHGRADGTYTLNAGSLSANNEIIGASGLGIFNQSGGTNTVTSNLILGQYAGSDGTYNLDGGVLNVGNIVYGAGRGVFNYNGGTLNVTGNQVALNTFISNSSFTLSDGQTLTAAEGITNNANGSFTVGASATVAAGGLGLVNHGLLNGTGTVVGNVISSGNVGPGNSPGMLSITGDYTQSSLGTFTAEIGGLLAGTQYDVLNVSGTAFLDGLLNVSLYDLGGGLFRPHAGDYFDILTASAITGSFSSLSFAALSDPNLFWRVSYLTDAIGSTDVVRLSIGQNAAPVPEPETYAMLLAGLGLLGFTARRRKNNAA